MTDHDLSRAARQTQKLSAEQAAQWLLVVDDSGGTAEQRREFAAWLRASPIHAQEFLNAKAVWEAMAGKACAGFPDSKTLLRELQTLPAQEVASLPGNAAAEEGRRPRRFRWAAAAAIFAIAVGTAALWLARPAESFSTAYGTAIGEQATHALPDGSTIVLNTNSRVQLQWSREFRDIRLEEGEALFEVAPDPARPFRVWIGESLVRALGTRFNVYRGNDALTVTVLEGRVEVTNATQASVIDAATDDASRVQLGAGEQASIRARQPIHTARLASPDRSVAWQTRRLVFENEPLSEVIRQFNRYHDAPLVLEDSDLGAKRVNGVFDASDRKSLIAFLAEFEGVSIEALPGKIVISRQAQP